MYNNFIELFSATNSENCLFLDKQREISNEEFKNNILSYISSIKQIKNTSIVLYIPDNTYEFYTLFLAIILSGKDVILPAFLTDNILKLLEKESNVIITNKEFKAPNFILHSPFHLKTDKLEKFSSFNSQKIKFFTSGSTNTPKIIEKTFISLLEEVKMHSLLKPDIIKEEPVIISTVNPYHIYGMLWRFLFPLCNQLSQELETISYPEDIQIKQEKYKKLFFISTPSFMREVIQYHHQYSFKRNIIEILSSGSLLNEEVSEGIYNIFGISTYEIFGSTETGGVAWRRQKEGKEWTIFPNVKMELDETKCIRINSPFSLISPFVMADGAEMTSNTSFVLLSRTDRMVKIAEKRVSLPEMEEKLNQYPFINQSYVLPIDTGKRTILAALLVLNPDGKASLTSIGKVNFIKELKKYLKNWFETVTIPRKIRFTEKIPTNAQGKVLKSEIASVFENKITEPIVLNRESSKEELKMDLCFMEEATYFNGHFPGCPILPGVIQIHFAFKFLKDYFDIFPEKYSINKLKFSNLILPKQKVTFILKKHSNTEFEFSYTNSEKISSSGKIKVES